ncbi:hypothetical protein evm_001297 [Chilo suppressalis]|nr:hypothetical protein evm_001297 [Chilo suppressalis]
MLIIGMKNTYIKERLLQEEGLTVESTMKIAKSLELSQERSSKLMRQDTKNEMVQGVKEQPQRYRSRSRSKIPDRSRSNQRQNYRNQSTRTRSKSSTRNCTRCGQIHKYKCPAQDKVCNICKKTGHFAYYCFFRKDKLNNHKEN